MNSPNANRSRHWPLWLGALLFVLVAGILALLLPFSGLTSTRWSSPRFLWLALILILPTFFYFTYRKKLPRFSLVTIFLLTGLVASVVPLSKVVGPPWKEVHRFPGDGNFAMSADGKLVAAGQVTSIEIRETQTGRLVQTIKMSAAEAKIKANQRWTFRMVFAHDGKSLLTFGWQTYPCLFDIETGKEQRRWPPTTTIGSSNIAAQGTRFVTGTPFVIKPSRIRQCKVYDIKQDQPILTVETSNVGSFYLSPAGSHVLIVKADTSNPLLQSSAELWAVDEGRLVATIPLVPSTRLRGAKFSPDGKLLAVPTSTGLAIWDVSQRRQLSQWNPAYFDKIWSIGWSPDASRLAVVYKEVDYFGKSRRMSFQTCSLLDRHCQEIATIGGMNATFSPSGDRIATVYKNTTIFDGETGDFLADLPSRVVSLSSGRQAIFFSPDGVWLLHNGIVHQRTRSERWYGVYELPPFWGLVLFLSALIVQMAKSIPLPRRSIASPLQQ